MDQQPFTQMTRQQLVRRVIHLEADLDDADVRIHELQAELDAKTDQPITRPDEHLEVLVDDLQESHTALVSRVTRLIVRVEALEEKAMDA